MYKRGRYNTATLRTYTPNVGMIESVTMVGWATPAVFEDLAGKLLNVEFYLGLQRTLTGHSVTEPSQLCVKPEICLKSSTGD
jgi:hypothetical protein